MGYQAGWQFLQIPGPSNVPRQVLSAMSNPTIDHRGPEFASLATSLFPRLKSLFGTKHNVVIFPSSGTGAWEAALTNVCSMNDRVVMAETGHFSNLWYDLALSLGFKAEILKGNWGSGADPKVIHRRLQEDAAHSIKAVCVVHNETSTGATTDIRSVRRAIDDAFHPALLIVDTISSLASLPYEHDAWGVDVTVAGSQKGLMLPPGLAFNAFGLKAEEATSKANFPSSYFNWKNMERTESTGQFPYTPATNLLFGLKAALDLLEAEGLQNVFKRHARHGRATRAAVTAWGLEILCQSPLQQSDVLTAVKMPDPFSADALRTDILDRFNMPLGSGLGKLSDKVFRIGHLGYMNDLMMIGAIGGIEIGLAGIGLKLASSGLQAAASALSDRS
ncbi:pyridoxal-phosphate-dependent aminotransferase family protein [Microvirga zambiensis]|uniref:pyridoxal-phosphate-dependent aminotransferase family protein n=1 Tax=Microvirga zambiensis TaxID=1402137 RepID=UPI00191F6216|nr:aminotransferase class V-fold PLP-dependent enzyme [Microvirga zambiensis]